MFLPDRKKFETFRGNPTSSLRPEWDDWCRLIHEQAGWTYMFWDEAAVDKLVAEVCDCRLYTGWACGTRQPNVERCAQQLYATTCFPFFAALSLV